MLPMDDSVTDDEWIEAYDRGCDAGEAVNDGKPCEPCPYVHGALRDAWDTGFREMTEPASEAAADPWAGASELNSD